MTISDRVRTYRKQRGFTQKELAQRTRLTQTYISSIEKNRRPRVSAEVLDRIAVTLGIIRSG